ncbi:MAG: Na+/H+ antiporter subunit E [Kiloniellales bacterium]|nr:Na+/H+ antiporter subunit E [Kiloniellales bacterium]
MIRPLLHAISLGVLLALIWLTLSGYLEPLLLAFGVISCIGVVLIAHRMNVIDHEGHPIHLGWRILAYWVWLIWEIVKSNIDVARRILDPALPISPCMVRVKTTQGSDLGQVIYANSITLTPGTVSIVVDDDGILVHAVAKELADDLETGEMDRRVTAVETRPPRPRKGA